MITNSNYRWICDFGYDDGGWDDGDADRAAAAAADDDDDDDDDMYVLGGLAGWVAMGTGPIYGYWR